MLEGAEAIAREFPQVIHAVRGRGLLVGIELSSEGYGGKILPEMLSQGITVAWTLNRQRVIRLEPPLIVAAHEIERCLLALRNSVQAAFKTLGTL